jgi:hypothetical protein
LKIAQCFSAGLSVVDEAKSRKGRKNRSAIPDGTSPSRATDPSDESPGYFQLEKSAFRFFKYAPFFKRL